MVTESKIYETLGRVSVLFSNLEADMGRLLRRLVSPEEPMIAAIILERASFFQILEQLEKISTFAESSIRLRLQRLLAIAKPLRTQRNLFVHGNWSMNPKDIAHGKVEVFDFKIKIEKKHNGTKVTRGNRHVFSLDELQKHRLELMRALKLARELSEEIEEDL